MAKATKSIRNSLKVTVAALALFGGTAALAQPAAAAAPAEETPQVSATWSCNTYFFYSGITRTCDVYQPYIRSYLRCSNGVTYFTPWLGRGSWDIRQACPAPYYRVASGIQSL
ncbi:hypothetical protein [Amycolatopsis anabasis]|uniref:hypothetical protein n=1 Tax=Amycolatopsis anabasis TaxID=1840409 RepID=UPI00131D7177|nr:hypothetical protein [Amycolatopsis anabasis]